MERARVQYFHTNCRRIRNRSQGIQNQVPEIRNPRPLNSESKTTLDYLAWNETFFILPAFYFRSFQYAEVIKFAANQAS